MAQRKLPPGTSVISLRLPPGLKQRIVAYAMRRGISQNAAIIVLVEEGLLADPHRHGDEPAPAAA